jgi:transposase
MWFTSDVRRILAYSQPMDLRKSIDGLVGVVKSVLEEDPLSGSLFVFVNRRGNYVKLVGWDRTGWCLFARAPSEARLCQPGADPGPGSRGEAPGTECCVGDGNGADEAYTGR